jgi:ammonium transporter Rh
MLAGAIAGGVSALGFLYGNAFCKEKFNLHDTCGVQFLHGIPGLLGGFTSVICCAAARYNFVEDPQLALIFKNTWNTRSYRQQAGFQLAAMGITLCIAITTGIIGGFIASRLPFPEHFFDDHDHFHEVEYGDDTAQFN